MHERRIRLVVSDFHIGTGNARGRFNPHEDFFEDDRFAELLDHHTRGRYAEAHVELVINGDFFDLLKVRVGGVWPENITEVVSTEKVRQCLDGHPVVVEGLRRFLERGRTRVTFIPGNHDIEMALPGPQREFTERIGGAEHRHRVHCLSRGDSYHLPEGIQIRHGHQFEAVNRVDYDRLMVARRGGEPVLALPWGSLFIIRVVNPAKLERYFIDHVVPLKRLLWGGLFFDFRFTVKFVARTIYHFVRTRFSRRGNILRRMLDTLRIFREEISPLADFDRTAMRTLRRTQGVHTLITGHSHGPRVRILEDGKLYVNTGTWVKLINVDLQHLGQDAGLTYAFVDSVDSRPPQTSLRQWFGSHRMSREVMYQG